MHCADQLPDRHILGNQLVLVGFFIQVKAPATGTGSLHFTVAYGGARFCIDSMAGNIGMYWFNDSQIGSELETTTSARSMSAGELMICDIMCG